MYYLLLEQRQLLSTNQNPQHLNSPTYYVCTHDKRLQFLPLRKHARSVGTAGQGISHQRHFAVGEFKRAVGKTTTSKELQVRIQ